MGKRVIIKFPYQGVYTLSFAIIGTVVIIWDFVDFLFFHSYLAQYDLLYADKGTIFIAFFTQQSNIITVIYFYFMACFHFNRKKLNNNSFLIRLFVTVYITVTSIIFTAGLLPGLVDSSAYDIKGWIFTSFLHYIIPIAMIIYYFWLSGRFHYSLRKFTKKSLYKIYIYPFFYFLFVMIRGELRHNNPKLHNLYDRFPLGSFDIEYPYWFLNYHHYPYGIAMIAVTFLFMFLLVTALTYLYLVLNNFIFERKQYKQSRVVQR